MSKSKSSRPAPSRSDRPLVAAQRRSSAAQATPVPPTVSGTWLISAIAVAIAAALILAWGTLCVLFWQGSWQLLYHPSNTVTRTPASVNLPFDSIGFATTASGEPELRGWWIPAASQPRYTAIYLHGPDGNMGDIISALVPLHNLGLNLFVFDYRGYGQSHFVHPSETRWREDVDSAIRYLTGTRHIPAGAIILVGRDLGANLALETAEAHPDLAGIVLEQPLATPRDVIFNDARSRLVPARLLVRDRWDTTAAASNMLIPSLWFEWIRPGVNSAAGDTPPQAYQKVPARKSIVWLSNSPRTQDQFNFALASWLDQLPTVSR